MTAPVVGLSPVTIDVDRRQVVMVAVVVAMGAGLYHAWRVFYFGSLLSARLCQLSR